MVEREESAWGVKLLLQPLSDRPEVQFVAEIATPKSDKTPDTRIWINGTLANKPIRITAMNALRNAIQIFVDAIKEEQSQLKEKVARRKK